MASTDMTDGVGRWVKPAASSVRAPSAARDPRLDFYRGIAMIIILFAHTPGNFFSSWIPARWGFSDATEIFVFCSGMASAIAFGRTYDRAGWVLGTARVAFRCWQVYWAHICLFIFVAAMTTALTDAALTDKNYMGALNLWKFVEDPGPQLVGLFTLTYVPNYFDVLPMYLVILAMMPLMIGLSRLHTGLAAVAVLGIWLMAQDALLEWLGVGAYALDLPAEPWSDRNWFFNPFGWQLVFFTGFALMRGWIPAPPVTPLLIGIALGVLLLCMPLSIIGMREFGFDWAREWRQANTGWFAKTDFGILRYVHFMALAYVAWAAAGVHGHRLVSAGDTALSRGWDRVVRNVMKIGQQSLAVFVFSMAFAQFLGFVLDVAGRDTATVIAVNALGVAALLGVAYSAGWFKGQPWRQKARA